MIRTARLAPAATSFGKRAVAPEAAASSPRTARVAVLGTPRMSAMARMNAETLADAAIRADWLGSAPSFTAFDGILARTEESRARKARDNRTLAGILIAVAVLALSSAFAGSLLTAGPAATYELVLTDAAGDAYVLDSGLSAEDCRTGLSAGMTCERETR